MSKVRGSWKNKIVDSSLQEERDKRDFDAQSAIEIFVRDSHVGRYNEAIAF